MSINQRNSQGRFAGIETNWDDLTPHEKMDKLDVYYSNNSLYDEVASYAKDNDYWLEAIKPLRNPTHRSVEFFASKLMMGTPKITIANKREQVLDAVTQFMKWSGFDLNKRPAIRKDALYGNVFKKVTFDGQRVFETILNSKHVTSFVEDERGFVIEIRIDVPLENRKTYTEYWIRNQGFDGYVAVWEHGGNSATPLDRLGTPKSFAFLPTFGIDFVPIVHIKFKDTGNGWGVSCVDHTIEKINEWDRKATVLSELMFQTKAFLIVRTGVDKDSIPLPAGNIKVPTDAEVARFGNFRVLKVPGAEGAEFSIPNFAWADFKSILDGDGEELQQDLPELRYYTVRENELSGIAMRTLLAGALDRAKEAQESLVTAQERSNAMGLTMGKFYGLFPTGIGDYKNGDFEHSLKFEEIIPASSQAEKIASLASMANVDLPIQIKMQLAGFSPEEIALVQPE